MFLTSQIPTGSLPRGSWPVGSLLIGVGVVVAWEDAIQIPFKSLPNGAWPQLSLYRSFEVIPPIPPVPPVTDNTGGHSYNHGLYLQRRLELEEKELMQIIPILYISLWQD